MPSFRENPRGGVNNGPIENGGELHLACVIVIDASGSMHGLEKKLHDALVTMWESLDPQARGRVEFLIILFNDDAQVLIPFCPSYDFVAPNFLCYGMTAMHAAVDLGMNELEARKEQYRANGTRYYRSWMFLLTDGEPNDPDNGAFERLLQYQKDGHCTFFPVAIGEHADTELLKTLQVDGVVLKATKENFQNAFVWLSNSLSKTSNSNQGQTVALPNPGDYQLTVVS